jgi:hypothetical protein
MKLEVPERIVRDSHVPFFCPCKNRETHEFGAAQSWTFLFPTPKITEVTTIV